METRDVDALKHGAADLAIGLRPPAFAALVQFLDLLVAWNDRIRLTGEREPAGLVKHVLDSLAVVPSLPSSGLVIDVGAGGGFPGIVLAIARPDLEVILLDARRRAVSFLRETARVAGLPNVRALHRRAEDAVGELGGRAATVISRALRPDTYLPLAASLVADDGVVLAMQTPGRVESARVLAAQVGLTLAQERTYDVPGAGRRALLVFHRLRP